MLADYRTAPIDEKLRATLAYLEKVTLTPSDVVAADARRVLDAGVSAKAVREALYVASLFAAINRLADAFGFELPTQAGFDAGAKALLRFGYR